MNKKIINKSISLIVEMGEGGQIANFGTKPPISFTIRKWPKNLPPFPSILGNLDNFAPGAFYLTPLKLSTNERVH